MDLRHSAQLPHQALPGRDRNPPASNRPASAGTQGEFRAFYGAIGLLAVIPLVAGPVTAFGGIDGLARLFSVEQEIVLSASLRNSARAVYFMFFGWVPLLIWSLAALPERAGAFRIAIGCAFLAGFARLTGYPGDGYPGPLQVVFMTMELAGMPLLLLWHARLVRLSRPAR
jgi:hypothetical protein